MRKLILEEWISLDGHVTDANGQLDFFTGFTPERVAFSALPFRKLNRDIATIPNANTFP
jgi:hypothetical protein